LPVSAKSAIRNEMRQLLKSLSPTWVGQVSLEINHRLLDLFALLPNSPKQILGWAPAFPGEVNLSSLFAAINSETESLKATCYLPKVEDDLSMSFISITTSSQNLSPSTLGIPEPEIGSGVSYSPSLEVAPTTLVLVPGLAFTTTGARLGRGKGCYDRFLSRPELKGAIKIGVCFASQLVSSIPTDEHDISVDFICCEERAIDCHRERGDI